MSNSNSGGGIGLGGAVFLVFLVLKLTNHIAWSWWWVTAPLWGLVALAAAILLVPLTIYGLLAAFGKVVSLVRRKV